MKFHVFWILICGILEIFWESFAFGQTCGKVIIARQNIVGGDYTIHGAFPWVAVLIDDQGDPFCGGTLVTKNKVVTAAHCMKGKSDSHEYLPRDITVILGSYNLSKVYEQGKISMGVESIDIHRDWNTKSASFDADIALLTLTDDVAFSRFVQPICLISSDSEPAKLKTGYSTGYGRSEKTVNHENVLKAIETPIANSNEECFYTDEALVKISSTRTFCGGNREGAGVCLGDSGNGLFVVHSQTYYLRGIVSASLYSNFNCDVYNHAIFTDVLKFNAWIVERLDETDRSSVYGPSATQVTRPRTTTTTTTTRRPTTTTTIAPKRSPSISQIQSPVEVIEGTNFELACKSIGSPVPNVCWSKAGHVDDNVMTSGNNLVITNVSFRNSGKYSCVATNSQGSDSIDVFLIVRSASSAGQVPWETRSGSSLNSVGPKQAPKQVTAVVGSRNEFKCSSDGSFRLEWRRADGQRLQSNAVSLNGLLVIDNVGHQDAGTYECIATDGFGNSVPVLSAKMEVVGGGGGNGNSSPNFGNSGGLYGGRGLGGTGGPKITFQPNSYANPVTAGDQLWITCVVIGAEPMTVNWAMVGRSSSTSSARVDGNTLKFDEVLMSDAGKYACIADNEYGHAEKSFGLFVTPEDF